jgi:excisionase family DNA binding protein
MLTVPEAARVARRDPETVRRWIRAGRLTARKVGTQHLIDEDDLAAFLDPTRPANQAHEAREAAAQYAGSPPVGPVPASTSTLDLWLPQIVGRLVRAMDPARIVLYGARARGDHRPDSDYELLVILDEVPDRRAARLEVRRLLDDLPISKDVTVAALADAEDPANRLTGLPYWALQEGTAIYDRP